MENKNRKNRSRLCRFAAALLACIMMAALAPAYLFTTKASAADEHGTVEGYEWHRVNKASDLPAKGTRCPVLILWEKEDNTIHYATGGYAGKSNEVDGWDAVISGSWVKGSDGLPNPFFGDCEETATFITTDVLTTWEMYITGEEDDDNHDAPMVRFYPNKSCLLTGYDDFDFPNKETADDDHWTIYTSEYGGKYGKNVKAGKVKIFANVKYRDTGFMYYGSRLYGYCNKTYNYDTFIMYWGERRNFSAFTDDYIVKAGQVLNIDDGVMLDEGKTIMIEPGGVMSVEGTFYNNGTIENHGTVIVQENACICCSPNVDAASGSILSSGASFSEKPYAEAQIARDERQIAELEALIGDQYTPNSLKAIKFTMQNAVGLMGQQLDADAEVVNKLEDQKDRLDMLEYEYVQMQATLEKTKEKGEDTEKLEADIAKKEKTIDDLRKDYKEALEPHQRKLDEYYEYEAQLNQVVAQLKAAEDTIAWLREDIRNYSSVTDDPIVGEGNLITLEGSKILIGVDKNTTATFDVDTGAHANINGYVFTPTTVHLGNGKLKVGRSGALCVGVQYTKGISGFPGWKAPELDDFDPDDEGFTAVSTKDISDILINTESYVLEVDGLLYCANAGPVTQYEMPGCGGLIGTSYANPNYGRGRWTYLFVRPAPSPTA